jgi:hypothetical protein
MSHQAKFDKVVTAAVALTQLDAIDRVALVLSIIVTFDGDGTFSDDNEFGDGLRADCKRLRRLAQDLRAAQAARRTEN